MRSHLASTAFVAAFFGLVITEPGAAVAANDPPGGPQHMIARWQINMPPQSVDEAIYQLAAVTGVQIFADGGIVAGRRTKSISGSYSAEDALKAMLVGTGLVVRSTDAESLMVTAALPDPKREEVRRHYSSTLQRAVVASLCAATDIGIGNYRLALRVWIAEQGRVERVDLLSSTGDQARDLRIRDVLQGISDGRPPDARPD